MRAEIAITTKSGCSNANRLHHERGSTTETEVRKTYQSRDLSLVVELQAQFLPQSRVEAQRYGYNTEDWHDRPTCIYPFGRYG